MTFVSVSCNKCHFNQGSSLVVKGYLCFLIFMAVACLRLTQSTGYEIVIDVHALWRKHELRGTALALAVSR